MRVIFWLAAVFFASIPIIFEVVGSPKDLNHLWSTGSYTFMGRDLILLAIAVLAIGLLDALETVLLLRGNEGTIERFLFAVTLVLVLGIVGQLLLYSYWSASIGHKLDTSGIVSTLYVVLWASISSLLARLNFVAAPR